MNYKIITIRALLQGQKTRDVASGDKVIKKRTKRYLSINFYRVEYELS